MQACVYGMPSVFTECSLRLRLRLPDPFPRILFDKTGKCDILSMQFETLSQIRAQSLQTPYHHKTETRIMATYSTKQRQIITDFLSRRTDSLLSAEEIVGFLSQYGISRSTVYRSLSKLEAEGRVKKLPKEGSGRIFYQYHDPEGCRGAIHLACKICGRSLHADQKIADSFVRSIEGSQEFTVDRGDTVVYGTCKECLDKPR